MLHVTHASHLGAFRIRLEFNDGSTGVVDLRHVLDGPIFQPLQDLESFAKFRLEGNTVAWENGADLAPEYLRDLAVQQTSFVDVALRNAEP